MSPCVEEQSDVLRLLVALVLVSRSSFRWVVSIAMVVSDQYGHVLEVGLPHVAASSDPTAIRQLKATEVCIEREETVYSIRKLCIHLSCRSRHRNATPKD